MGRGACEAAVAHLRKTRDPASLLPVLDIFGRFSPSVFEVAPAQGQPEWFRVPMGRWRGQVPTLPGWAAGRGDGAGRGGTARPHPTLNPHELHPAHSSTDLLAPPSLPPRTEPHAGESRGSRETGWGLSRLRHGAPAWQPRSSSLEQSSRGRAPFPRHLLQAGRPPQLSPAPLTSRPRRVPSPAALVRSAVSCHHSRPCMCATDTHGGAEAPEGWGHVCPQFSAHT